MKSKKENTAKTEKRTSGLNMVSVYIDPYKYIPLPVTVNGYGVNLI